jgi:hypothetical protein
MNTLFGTRPLGWDEWWKSLLMALIVFPVISFEKWIRRRREKGQSVSG